MSRYRLKLPAIILGRSPPHMNHEELVRVMEWKLTRGKMRCDCQTSSALYGERLTRFWYACSRNVQSLSMKQVRSFFVGFGIHQRIVASMQPFLCIASVKSWIWRYWLGTCEYQQGWNTPKQEQCAWLAFYNMLLCTQMRCACVYAWGRY